MTSSKQVCISVSFTSGSPDPIRTVSTPNWTIRGVACSRTRLVDLRAEPYYRSPGLYVLVGPGAHGRDLVYVGEAERVGPRVEQHKGDYWDRVAVFTAENRSLNKAHVKHLEAELVRLGRKADRCELKNDKQPKLPMLSPLEQSITAEFLGQILALITALGLPYFEQRVPESKPISPPTVSLPPAAKASDELHMNRKGVVARGRTSPGAFLVFAGATAAKQCLRGVGTDARKIRQELIADGVLVDDGQCLKLIQDHTFPSAAIAAQVLRGRGATAAFWNDAQGQPAKFSKPAAAKATGASA